MPEENPRLGGTLERLLRGGGIFDDATSEAIKAVLAAEVQAAMNAEHLSKTRMAERMGTSRSQLDCLLDLETDNVTLRTLRQAAAAVGMRLELGLRKL